MSRRYLIAEDPNLGENKITPHEDLCIYVNLETNKKSRSNISVTTTGAKTETVNDKTLRVKFLEGSEVGKIDPSNKNTPYSLTTNYTKIGNTYKDATVIVKKGEDLEGFGMTNIDINFNSAYAPQITIDFIDIRGAAILEQGNDSKYNVFFNLPYPIFELTIKGYFGKSVTYCLHLTKWNAKFNSQTGNFEIKCEFIGHTYAFLTDMLIGYLKASVQTPRGREIFDSIKQTKGNGNLLTINELISEIGSINNVVKDFKGSQNVSKIAVLNEVIISVNDLKQDLLNLPINIVEDKHYTLFGENDYFYIFTNNTNSSTDIEKMCNDEVTDSKEKANNINEKIDLNSSELRLNISVFEKYFAYTCNGAAIKSGSISGLNDDEIKTVQKILENKTSATTPIDSTTFFIVNISKVMYELNSKIMSYSRLSDVYAQSVSKELKDKINKNTKLDLSIGNITHMLCAHVDVFMQLIRETALKAIESKSREDKLKKFLGGVNTKLDIPKDSKEIYPFPGYEKNNKEEWIGNDVNGIPETDLVESLLNGFMKVAKQEAIDAAKLKNGGDIWYPIHIFDTPLFNSVSIIPEINKAKPEDLPKILYDRAFIQLHYANRGLTKDEIKTMARIEAMKVYSSENSVGVRALIGNDLPGISIIGKISNFMGMQPDSHDTGDDTAKNVYTNFDNLPLIYDSGTTLSNISQLSDSNTLNTTNSEFVRFITLDKYENNIGGSYPDHSLDEYKTKTSSSILLDDIIDVNVNFDNTIGSDSFDLLSGKYKTQEFFKLKGIDKELDKEYDSNILFWEETPAYNGFYNGGNDSHYNIVEGGLLGKDIYKPGVNLKYNNTTSNLFTSDLYFKQYEKIDSIGIENVEKVHALLFLGTLPLIGSTHFYDEPSDNFGVITNIISLFNKRSGFIKVPKAWVYFIGGLLWRYELNDEPFTFYSNLNPERHQYINGLVEELYYNPFYKNIEGVLLNLPISVKNAFINYFEDWVNNGWLYVKKIYEVNNITTYDEYKKNKEYRDTLFVNINNNPDKAKELLKGYITVSKPIDSDIVISNIDTVNVIIGISKDEKILSVKYNTSIISQDIKNINDYIYGELLSPIILANSTWRIWATHTEITNNGYENVYGPYLPVSEDNMVTYFNHFKNVLKKQVTNEGTSTSRSEELSKYFGVLDNDLIKLNIYRTIKAIYDKWVAGTDLSKTGVILCGRDYRPLYSTFKFLDTGFNDISHEFLLNPVTLMNELNTNINQSFYDLISRILVTNNFEFIPLPTFINYQTEENLRDIFTPYPYNKSINDAMVEPSFVCVYVGQTSKHLNTDGSNSSNSTYDDDGIFFTTDTTQLPTHFLRDDGDNNIPVFSINYGQQNQGLFKDIRLDQSEFSETDESLRIIEELSLKGDTINRTILGQNLFNVYSTRAYQAEVECMGNAMIQPMMYFGLKNIPLFKGGYLITRVNHKIKANSMTTTFRGVRVRRIQTPLIKENELFMNLLGSMTDIKATDTKLTNATNDLECINFTLTTGKDILLLDKLKSYNGIASNDTTVEDKLRSVSTVLRINPNWLIAIMLKESVLKSNADNNKDSLTLGGAGLIQFTQRTRDEFNRKRNATNEITKSRILKMSVVEQLDLIQEFYGNGSKIFNNVYDLAIYTFAPSKIGSTGRDIIYEAGTSQANSNFGYQVKNSNMGTIGSVTAESHNTEFIRLVKEKINEIDKTIDYKNLICGVYYG